MRALAAVLAVVTIAGCVVGGWIADAVNAVISVRHYGTSAMSWLAANLKLRADRDAMDARKRREAEAARKAAQADEARRLQALAVGVMDLG